MTDSRDVTAMVRDATGVLTRIERLLGRDASTLEDGLPVARPASTDEAAALIRVAREQRWRVVPMGAGLGPLPYRDGGDAAPDLVLATTALSRVEEYEADDLVVRAGSGVTLDAVQKAVAGAGQYLALDPPGGAAVTLGGIVATGASGPLRARYGRPRDQLLGLTLVDGRGRILELGGKVVKNVAGFDLVRLAAGSRGRLGVITGATFRLYSRPDEDRTLTWSFPDVGEAWDVGRALALHPAPLMAVEMLGGTWSSPLDGPAGERGVPFRILARLGGSVPEVASVRDALISIAGEPAREMVAGDSEAMWAALSERDGVEPVSLRAHALSDRGRSLARAVSALPGRFALHLLHGTYRLTLPPDSDPASVRPLAEVVRRAGGILRFLRAPAWIDHSELQVGVGRPPALRALEARVIEAFDPSNLFPGERGAAEA